MADPFIGEIRVVGFNFPPRGWALCEGQLLAIAQNTALFSLLGTTFGGDGRTTFGLPDLRGRAIVGQGNGPGLSPITWGEKGGAENVTLTAVQMPPHNHTAVLHAEATAPTTQNPTDNLLAGGAVYAPDGASPERDMSAKAIVVGNTGGGQPFSTRDPFLGLYICIAVTGIYPSRS